MNSFLKTLIFFLASALPLLAIGKLPGPEETIVTIIKDPLPSEENARAAFLWKQFANKPEEKKFDSYEMDNWKQNYTVFAEALTKKAEAQGLDGASLRRSLGWILKKSSEDKDKTALLPVGAYQTTLDGKPVWIVIVKWEMTNFAPNLGHIMMFAFEQKTLKVVGFNTCT